MNDPGFCDAIEGVVEYEVLEVLTEEEEIGDMALEDALELVQSEAGSDL